ncbi:hypothetical protein F5B20DRAFT_578708 [Whalleya microplaca]|nr:hypothetical protein F5B20DRAFT_578708 [Whalleya microplaca]
MTQVVEHQPYSEAMNSEPVYTDADAQYVSQSRPVSTTTSQLSLAGRRDYGMKFMAGVDEMALSTASPQDRSTTSQAPTVVPPEAVAAPAPAPAPTASRAPPPYREMPRTSADTQLEVDDGDDECHPFWVSWWDMLKGIGYIIGGALKIPLVFGHGIAKVLYYIPVLYKDESVRPWPKITGFATGCVAAFTGLFFGIWDGATDWITLPYKCARKEGFKGFFKGFAQGLGNIIFKPASGTIGFACHPFFGIYKEASKFKLSIKRERRVKKKIESPV